MGNFMNKTEGKKNMARVKRTGSAGGAGTCADSHHIKAQKKAFAFDSLNGNIYVSGKAVFSVAVKAGFFNFKNIVDKFIAENFCLRRVPRCFRLRFALLLQSP